MSSTPNAVSSLSSGTDSPSFLAIEYAALNEQIVKYIENQNQIMSLALVAAGTFMSLGVEFGTPSVVFLYPFLGAFLTVAWVFTDLHIRQTGTYMKLIEKKCLSQDEGFGWNHVKKENTLPRTLGSILFLSGRGIFLGTQLAAVFAGLWKAGYSMQDNSVNFPGTIFRDHWVLLLADIAAFAFTLFLVSKKWDITLTLPNNQSISDAGA